MSSLSPKDRVSLCSFTFADGRRCRTPRISSHPHFCYYHAQKEARAFAADKLSKDLAYFFSGDYLSACDLSTALGRLIPAVVRGDLKPKTAHTVAYPAQTLMQAIHVSQHEYCEAFSSDAWCRSVRNSVKGNYNYGFPPAPQPEPPAPLPPQPHPAETPANCHSERSEESASSSNSSLATHHSFTPSVAEGPLPQVSQPAPSPHTPLPPTSAEFVQQVMAGRNLSRPGRETGGSQLPQPAPATQPTPPQTPSSTRTQAPPTSARACHPDRSEGSCLDPAAPATDETHLVPATQVAPPVPQAAQPNNPAPTTPPTPPPSPNRDAPWLHFGDPGKIRPDSHLL